MNSQTNNSPEKQLLLAVTGMSPAVITETLFCIAQKDQRWPDRIYVLTTEQGKERLVSLLIDGGWLDHLCERIGKPNIQFLADDIHVIEDVDGSAIEDARSELDHEALADFITTTVRDLTAKMTNRNTATWQIHASIAGGRKTMTFYLGYAMSLFGRHYDQMSHVLVSEGYETDGFYFPLQTKQKMVKRARSNELIAASDAEVILSDIPFIRMRHQLPDLVKSLGKNINYRQLVGLINFGDNLSQIYICLDREKLELRLFSGGFEGPLMAKTPLQNPALGAFYSMILKEAMRDPEGRKILDRPTTLQRGGVVMAMFVQELQKILVCNTNETDDVKILTELNTRFGDDYSQLDRTLTPIIDSKVFDSKRFSNYISNISKILKQTLPSNLVKHLTPSPIYDPTNGEVSTGRLDNGGYGLRMQPQQVKIS